MVLSCVGGGPGTFVDDGLPDAPFHGKGIVGDGGVDDVSCVLDDCEIINPQRGDDKCGV